VTKDHKLSRIAGIFAIVLLDVALNFLLLKQDIFTASVVLPFLGGLVLGIFWIILRLTRLASAPGPQTSAHGINAVVATVVVFGICLALFAFTRHSQASWDLTREGRRQLSPQTVQVLESLNQDVQVYGLFVSAADSMVAITEEKARRFLERCQAHTAYLTVQIIDPEKDPLTRTRLNVTRLSTQGTVVVRCGARQRVIPISAVTGRLEEREFTHALINVVRNANPKVYFLRGLGPPDKELDIDNPDEEEGGSDLRAWLEKESYTAESISLPPRNPEIPSDCDVFVMNPNQRDLHPLELKALQEYVDRGGRVLILLDIWTVKQMPGRRTVEQLRPWLEQRFGITVGEDLVLSPESRAEIVLMPDFGPAGGDSEYRGSFNDSHPITRGMDLALAFTGARSVRLAEDLPEGVAGEELLRSFPDCWAETNLELLFDPDNPSARPEPFELTGSIAIAAAVAAQTETPLGDTGRTREARLVVIGNREFVSNKKIRIFGHVNLIMNALAWLTESEELIGIRATGHEDPPIVLAPAQEQTIAWIASLGMLHVIALAGIAMHVLRGKYQ